MITDQDILRAVEIKLKEDEVYRGIVVRVDQISFDMIMKDSNNEPPIRFFFEDISFSMIGNKVNVDLMLEGKEGIK